MKENCPWCVPYDVKIKHEYKHGYHQVKYLWTQNGWRYEVRYHEPTPNARLIKYPSWRLDRVKPGKGFGPDHSFRLHQILVGTLWLDARQVYYAASQVSHNKATQEQIKIIKDAHFKNINRENK